MNQRNDGRDSQNGQAQRDASEPQEQERGQRLQFRECLTFTVHARGRFRKLDRSASARRIKPGKNSCEESNLIPRIPNAAAAAMSSSLSPIRKLASMSTGHSPVACSSKPVPGLRQRQVTANDLTVPSG